MMFDALMKFFLAMIIFGAGALFGMILTALLVAGDRK